MRENLGPRQLLAIAMAAPTELWVSLVAVVLVGLVESLRVFPLADRGDSVLLGGTGLVGACVAAACGLLIAILGDWRGLLLAVAAFAMRALWYFFHTSHPLGELLANQSVFDPDPGSIESVVGLPIVLLLPCASPRALRYLGRMRGVDR